MAAAVEVLDSGESIAQEWDDLATRVGASPFMRPGWLLGYWRSREVRTPLHLVCLRDHDRLVGLAPLHVCDGVLRSLGHAAQTPFVPLAEPGTRESLAAAMLDRRWSRLSLTYLPGDDPATDELVHAARALGWRSQARFYERTVEIDLTGGLEAVESRLSGKKRANLRRRRRRLGELGELTFTINDGRDAWRDDLDRFIALEASGWKGPRGSGTAIACRPESQRFFAEMAGWAAAAGTLRLSFVGLDGRPLAALLGLEDGDAYYAVRTAYDESYRQHSPSDVLLHHHIADLSARGAARLVILGRDEPYKREWSEEGRDHVIAHLFPPTLRGRLQWFGYHRVRPAVVWAREHGRRGAPSPPSSSSTT